MDPPAAAAFSGGSCPLHRCVATHRKRHQYDSCLVLGNVNSVQLDGQGCCLALSRQRAYAWQATQQVGVLMPSRLAFLSFYRAEALPSGAFHVQGTSSAVSVALCATLCSDGTNRRIPPTEWCPPRQAGSGWQASCACTCVQRAVWLVPVSCVSSLSLAC